MLPSAVPGILAGVILAIGRIVGETAALIYTAGTVAKVPENVFSSVRTLSVHMYNLSKEGLNTNQAYATAVRTSDPRDHHQHAFPARLRKNWKALMKSGRKNRAGEIYGK